MGPYSPIPVPLRIRMICLLLLIAPLLLGFPRASLAESPWTVELGLGQAGPFRYRTLHFSLFDYPEHMGSPVRGFVALGRASGQHLSLWSEVGYVRYETGTGAAMAGSGTTWGFIRQSLLITRLPSLGLGVRYSLGSPYVAGPPKAYVQFLPTMYLTNWRESTEYVRVWGGPVTAKIEDSFSKLAPGFESGIGMVGPLLGQAHVDVGFRYRYSANLGARNLGMFSRGEFDGLRQFEFVGAVRY